ncbi:hypoxanthine phosphoribosyltransferase [Mailhella massiliensis]|uniref:Hypoxanthine phosphoribosyltransferase n=1 Tax=Mailhella massiliensis TaxID=1903261 RepID=A0A921AUA2_9BACT|nr:hypoxanthine phosphoribosyltransferase [Mailhella massiliensis]HJD96206.1 hypoxanthine phosphoribosyltransferase [Mailhella massiliensis]
MLREILGEERIRQRVAAMAEEIDELYRDESVIAVCVLKGAFFFFSDLVRAMKTETVVDFVRLASYGAGQSSSGEVRIIKDVEVNVAGRHVLIIEDIVDSGRSMNVLVRHLAALGAKSVRIAVLIDKKERREFVVHTDFVGFDLPAGFIVGYGLDCAERYRNLPAIYELLDC